MIKYYAAKMSQFKAEIAVNSIRFTKFTMHKWFILTSKIDQIFSVIGVISFSLTVLKYDSRFVKNDTNPPN